MQRPRCWLAAALALAPASAFADEAERLQVGAFFGPRLYSQDSRLGFIEDAPAHPMLDNAIQLGVRMAKPLLPWLVAELELAFAPTDTKPAGGAASVSVFWMEPRLHVRYEPIRWARVAPFVVFGGGAPIALSSARKTYDSDVLGEGYAGAGVRFDTLKGFVVRFDARVGVMPGALNYLAVEGDVGIGLELSLGKQSVRTGPRDFNLEEDKDNDRVADGDDKCVDRAEDRDGFEDGDGCPDIDNDYDRVLDVADRCPTVAETYNGFDDNDGCADTLPPEVDALRGTVEGLIYGEGETAVRDGAQKSLQQIANVMAAHASIKVLLIGHTDDREAQQFAEVVEGQPAPDLELLAEDLSKARAEAARQALESLGVLPMRVEVQGRGYSDPVSDNESARGRSANRRVEIKLYIPPR